MRPFPRTQLTEYKRMFNYRLSRGRRVVESAFGILAAKCRILNTPMETSPDMVDKIVKCLCVLHKTIIDREGIDEASLLEIETVQNDHVDPEGQFTRANNRCTLRAKRVRDAFTVYFNSDVGRLPESNL
jgi:hypothetical protein